MPLPAFLWLLCGGVFALLFSTWDHAVKFCQEFMLVLGRRCLSKQHINAVAYSFMTLVFGERAGLVKTKRLVHGLLLLVGHAVACRLKNSFYSFVSNGLIGITHRSKQCSRDLWPLRHAT